jgi:CTP-dependent riboflavin kinase
MATLRFKGVVRTGIGRFSVELTLPRRSRLSVPIRDWPEALQPGTLNVRIDEDGFPSEFLKHFAQANVRKLDSRRFVPEAELRWDEIAGNTLPPLPDKPDRGNAQVWRAHLRNLDSGIEKLCWVVRRIGSGLSRDLELVAGERLRDSLGLKDGMPVEVEMEGSWLQA